MITGKTLISWGFRPGSHFQAMIPEANRLADLGAAEHTIIRRLEGLEPPELIGIRTNSIPFEMFIEPETEDERENLAGSVEAMDKLMRVPTVKAGVLMPDTMPAGVIPVGAIVATENAIHPGFHSSDICCSMAITVFKRDVDLGGLLDVAQRLTHFGPGKRAKSQVRQNKEVVRLIRSFEDNSFLHDLQKSAEDHFMTQGDGNHFLFVGRLRSTGQPAIVTHHGSRSLGSKLYKKGKAAAQRETRKIAKGIDPKAAWLVADSQLGQDYWDALQLVRQWTKLNHLGIHDLIAKKIGNAIVDRFWNEHNFVFQRSDGLFYHAKGATPSYRGFSADDDGRTLIPMNMAEPILITEHTDRKDALGFAPHGAGRNMSRTRFLRENPDIQLPEGIDVRFFTGTPDLSELPGAYKSAAQVIGQIHKHKLANVVDHVDPYGSIMAGEVKWN